MIYIGFMFTTPLYVNLTLDLTYRLDNELLQIGTRSQVGSLV